MEAWHPSHQSGGYAWDFIGVPQSVLDQGVSSDAVVSITQGGLTRTFAVHHMTGPTDGVAYVYLEDVPYLSVSAVFGANVAVGAEVVFAWRHSDAECDCDGNVMDVVGVCGGGFVDDDGDGICDTWTLASERGHRCL